MRVIPVLVDGAEPLRQEQLPAELRKLARLNALELSYGRYEYDADRLLNLIQQVLAAVPDTGTAPEFSSPANPKALAVLHDVRPDENVPWPGGSEGSRSCPRKTEPRTIRVLD